MTQDVPGLLPLLAASFGLCVALTWGLRWLLLRISRVDLPRQDRWHQIPVPRPGGPAIFLTVMAGIVALAPRPWERDVWGLLVGVGFIFAVGLLDDFLDLPNPLKLALLIIGALIPPAFGMTFRALPPAIDVPLSIAWVLVVTNALNWLDNMDGLAAGTAAIAAGALFWVSLGRGSIVGAMAVLIIGACLGFLVFNFHPARIFMGDSGSGMLGFMLAVLALIGGRGQAANVLLTLFVPVMILSVPLFDTALVSFTRLFGGRRLFQGGTDHPSHRLVVLGLTERRAVLSLYVLSLLSGVAALLSSALGPWSGLALGGIVLVLFLAFGLVLARVLVYEGAAAAVDHAGVVLAQAAHKRRLLEILIDAILLCAAYVGAFLLRFEGAIPRYLQPLVGASIPVILGTTLATLYAFGVYRRDWRYTGWLDLIALAKALALGSLAFVAAMFMKNRLVDFPRAVFVLDWVLAFVLLGGVRVSAPLLQEYFASYRTLGKRVLVFGAGQGAVLLLDELRNNPALGCCPVGLVDDDSMKRGAIVRGVRVLGSRDDLPALARNHKIAEVLIAIPSLSPEALGEILTVCRRAGVPARVAGRLLEPGGWPAANASQGT